jgi:hypothetical protein
MEKFITQFTMSGVKTNATVYDLGGNEYDFVIHLSDTFEGGEETPAEDERDGRVTWKDNTSWELVGESKVTLSEEDIQSLGSSIENAYIKPNSAP